MKNEVYLRIWIFFLQKNIKNHIKIVNPKKTKLELRISFFFFCEKNENEIFLKISFCKKSIKNILILNLKKTIKHAL